MSKAVTVLYVITLTVAVFALWVGVSHAATIDSITRTSGSDYSLLNFEDPSFLPTSYHWKLSQQYIPGASHNICTVTVSAKANSATTPTDSVSMYITMGSSTDPYSQTVISRAVAAWQIRGTTAQNYTYTFSPCAVVVGANPYNINLERSSGSSGVGGYSFAVCNGSSAPSKCVSSGTGTFNFSTITGVAGTSLMYGFSSASSIHFLINNDGVENFGVSDVPKPSLSISSLLAGFTDANASSTLTTETGAFAQAGEYLATRAPFGYLIQIYNIYSNTSTTSTAFAAISYDFTDTHISTGTRAFLPSSALIVFSTSTVTSLIGTTLLGVFNALVSATIWMGFLYYLVQRIRSLVPTTA